MNGDQTPSLQRLLQRITQHQETACQEILAAAEQQAAELVATATAEAKQRKERAKKVAKQQWNATIASRQARQATEKRLNQLRQTQTVLDQGWQMLLEALHQRWHQAEARALWVAMLVQRAEQLFTTDGWTVIHPPSWQPAELGNTNRETTFQADATLTAGLRIGSQGAWLDGTIEGMVANRQELSALLLAQLQHDEESA